MMKYVCFFIALIIITSCSKKESSNINKRDIKKQVLINMKGDTVNISELITHKCLVLRYSMLDCRSCVDSIFYQLNKYSKNIGIDDICILTYYENIRHFIVLSRLNQNKYKTFQIPNNQFFIKEDSLQKPYFFVINKNLEISSIFIVHNITEQKNDLNNYLSNIAFNHIMD